MREQLKESMKAKDAVRTQALRYWIAQLTKGDGTELSDDDAVKKMRSVLKEAAGATTTFSPEEIAFIKEWVPANLSADQIAEKLAPVADQIKAAPKEGMAMGVAMKALAGLAVDSADVKEAIAQIRA
jgi:uncharacterized protein YqeY